MFISNKEKESIVNNIKYLLQGHTDLNQTLLLIMTRLDRLDKKGKPAPKKRGRPPKVQAAPKKRGRPPKVKNA